MVQSNNEIKDTITGWITNEISRVHTAIPGTIVSYNPDRNRAQVQPVGMYKLPDGRALDYPVIHHVPVQFPLGTGGHSGVTFPLAAGDGCLLIFSESQMDDYLSGGDSDDPRMHDLNDAICIPGLYSGAAPSNVSHSDDTCLFNGGSLVHLGSGGFSGTLADGTTFSFSGGDLVVNGISLTEHLHGGVEPGGGKTGKPE
jgi:hypothetical protein|nr:MAG TPA: baseplate protein [Caudoviricetes sp.]